MNQDKKKARPAGDAAGRAKREKQQASGYSHPNHTTPIPQAQAKIADLLLPGRENAIPRRDLEAITGLDRAHHSPDDRAGAQAGHLDFIGQPPRLFSIR